ncbi:acyl-CoA dehydrogenase family protein [Streptococcus marmotae]|uniref:acyl-CoA dehydrogenase family protein n=1 Tax=Streptococcus marmotae TaxID=1825069 RepID=UPI001F348492|nr:acyl-CoA dehydrogenase [Streptococcus marmotae]
MEKVKSFIQTDVMDKARYYDINEVFPERLWRILTRDLRIFELLVDYPTNKKGFRTFLEIIRLLSKEFSSLASIAFTQGIYGVILLQQFGTQQQKEAYLADFISCQKMVSFAFSEKDIDLEREAPTTIARQTETGWVLSGHKHKIANVTMADVVLILATTIDPYGEKGTGIFIADLPNKKVTLGPSIDKIGLRAMPLAFLHFDSLTLSKESLLGQIQDGFFQWGKIIQVMWLASAAQSLGIAEGAFEKGLSCCQLKRNFGKRPIDVEINQFKFADMKTKLAACEAYYNNCILHQMEDENAAAILRVLSSETARVVADEAIRITGTYSFVAGNDIERYVRDAAVASIYGGSTDGLRRKIAKDWL